MKNAIPVLLILLLAMACQPPKDDGAKEKKDGKAPEIKIDKEYFSAEMLMSLKRITEHHVSPDGKWIVFAMKTPNPKENKFTTDLYLIAIDGKDMKQLTRNSGNNENAVWFPDSKKIAYVSTLEETPQIYVMEISGGASRRISDVKTGVSNISVSPDGKHFAFTSEIKMMQTPQEKYPDLPKAKIRIYEKVPVRHWSEWTDENVSHLFVLPVEGGEAKDLTKESMFDIPLKPFGGAEQIAWSPDGKEIAYTCKMLDGADFVEQTNSDIYLIPVTGGEPKNITKGMMGYDMNPAYSPDGKYIAFISMENNGFESDKQRLMLFDRGTGEIKDISVTFDGWVGSHVWSADSKTIYYNSDTKGTTQIFKISVPDGTWKQVTEGWYDHNMPNITPDGKTIIFQREDMMKPVDLFAVSSEGGVQTQLTKSNEDLAKLKKVKITERIIKSADGADVHCWVVFPPDFDSTKQYPMISFCQGGPQSMISQRFHYRWNYYLMASKGYVLLLPNRRGMPGFGQAWNNAISKDWAGKPMQDILAATDAMLKEPYIKKDGVSAVGASAGGYAVFWLEGNHNGRFKAFISHCGVFNFESMYGSTEELWFPNWEYGGPYWNEKNKANYMKNSPHNFADKWDTPIMISTGENDFRVPFTQSLEAYTVAQVKRIPSKLVVFPNETHFISHPQEFIMWSREFFEFLDKYTKNN